MILGTNSLSRIEVVSLLNLNNSSQYSFYSMEENKYNPKIYIGTKASVALYWIGEVGTPMESTTHWPESFLSYFY